MSDGEMRACRLARKYMAMVRFGNDLARLSAARLRKTAAVVFSPDCQRVFGIGINGQAPGVPHERSGDSPDAPTGDLHAEVNALMKSDFAWAPRFSLVMYQTASPCLPCAGLTIASEKIGLVIVGEAGGPMGREEDGEVLLRESGILVLSFRDVERTVAEAGTEVFPHGRSTAKFMSATHSVSRSWRSL